VLLWEDLHWAEATLLDLINEIATAATGTVLMLCTARSSFAEVWQRSLPGEAIELAPLPADAIEQFVDGLGGSPIDATARQRIIDSAEGNPLYAEQLFSMLVDDGVLQRTASGWKVDEDIGDLPIPPTIHALLAARLDGLRAEERAIVDIASVVGLEFARDAVNALVPA
jgi:predicted ATPase